MSDLISIDPYFKEGFYEGDRGIWRKRIKLNIDKHTKLLAAELYSRLGLKVRQIEEKSIYGLTLLEKENKKFQMIYIDGSHEGLNPLLDFAFSYRLLEPSGVILLDDYYWPDVSKVKSLCDIYCMKIHHCWKVSAYFLEK